MLIVGLRFKYTLLFYPKLFYFISNFGVKSGVSIITYFTYNIWTSVIDKIIIIIHSCFILCCQDLADKFTLTLVAPGTDAAKATYARLPPVSILSSPALNLEARLLGPAPSSRFNSSAYYKEKNLQNNVSPYLTNLKRISDFFLSFNQLTKACVFVYCICSM